ncbi:MAG: hypothetical protein KGJ23_07950 [Euryarchaeota archaeon]|nr:hypothetical protein [Euryarchaeota archaeon]MDE1836533.1 hypothetical protein [Euryarchaeota archaeon]MDE1879272.1 hypothetical protein [Euryarchaeota archaeon]MDE2044503.1 hypothetical protein [Thermoplasmata archaeon]
MTEKDRVKRVFRPGTVAKLYTWEEAVFTRVRVKSVTATEIVLERVKPEKR